MGDHHRDSSADSGLNRLDRRALAILERSAAKAGLGLLWGRLWFQLAVVWGAQVAISAGVVASVAALVTIWYTMSSHIVVALGAEVVLTAGALLVAHGIRLWWNWSQAKRSLR